MGEGGGFMSVEGSRVCGVGMVWVGGGLGLSGCGRSQLFFGGPCLDACALPYFALVD